MPWALDRPSSLPKEDGLLIPRPGPVGSLESEGVLPLPEGEVRPLLPEGEVRLLLPEGEVRLLPPEGGVILPAEEGGVILPAGENGIPLKDEEEVPFRLEAELLPTLLVEPSPCSLALPETWLDKLPLVPALLGVLPLAPAPPASWLPWGLVFHLFVSPMLPSAVPFANVLWP